METRTEAKPTESDLIGRVVAWHNRHWLTRRIGPAQVTGIGVVALPFAAAAVGSATDRTAAGQADPIAPKSHSSASALARMIARLRPFSPKGVDSGQPLFRDDFIAPLKAREIARFARLHGSAERPGDPAWPQRDIPVARGGPRVPTEIRFVQTAAIEAGRHRLRVLVGSGADPQVIGPRLWDRRRLAAVVTSAASMVAVASALSVPWSALLPDAAISGSGVLPGDSQTAAVSAAPAPPTPPVASDGVDEAASDDSTAPQEQEDPAADPAPATPVAADEAAASGDILVKGGDSREPPRRDEAGPASGSSPPATPPAAIAKPADRKAATEASPAGQQPLFAVAIQPTRTRVASQLRLALLNLPTEPQAGTPHADIMKVSQGWRAVIWPFADRESAESVRQTLAARGIEVEVIDF